MMCLGFMRQIIKRDAMFFLLFFFFGGGVGLKITLQTEGLFLKGWTRAQS